MKYIGVIYDTPDITLLGVECITPVAMQRANRTIRERREQHQIACQHQRVSGGGNVR